MSNVFGPQWPSPIHDPHSRNAQAHADDFHGAYNTDHSQHRMNPGLAKHGFGESPCGYSGCTHHDPDFMDRMDAAYDSEPRRTTVDFTKVKPHGMEASIDWGQVKRAKEGHPMATRKKNPPQVFHDPKTDSYHIADGHHRIIADKLTGRPSVVDLRSL